MWKIYLKLIGDKICINDIKLKCKYEGIKTRQTCNRLICIDKRCYRNSIKYINAKYNNKKELN